MGHPTFFGKLRSTKTALPASLAYHFCGNLTFDFFFGFFVHNIQYNTKSLKMQGNFKFFIYVLHGGSEGRDDVIGGFFGAPKNRFFEVKNRVFR